MRVVRVDCTLENIENRWSKSHYRNYLLTFFYTRKNHKFWCEKNDGDLCPVQARQAGRQQASRQEAGRRAADRQEGRRGLEMEMSLLATAVACSPGVIAASITRGAKAGGSLSHLYQPPGSPPVWKPATCKPSLYQPPVLWMIHVHSSPWFSHAAYFNEPVVSKSVSRDGPKTIFMNYSAHSPPHLRPKTRGGGEGWGGRLEEENEGGGTSLLRQFTSGVCSEAWWLVGCRWVDFKGERKKRERHLNMNWIRQWQTTQIKRLELKWCKKMSSLCITLGWRLKKCKWREEVKQETSRRRRIHIIPHTLRYPDAYFHLQEHPEVYFQRRKLNRRRDLWMSSLNAWLRNS